MRPILGRDAVAKTFQSSANRGGRGECALERKLNASTTLLRWKGTIDGRPLESLAPLMDDANGLLIERTIARPTPPCRYFGRR